MKNLKKTFKDYFAFGKSERRGIFVLLVILLLIITINILLPYLVTRQKIDFSNFEANIANWEKTKEVIAKKQYSYQKKENHFDFNNSDKSTAESKIAPFNFNPNDLPEEKWKELGLTDKQIKVLKNYEAKGGKFYKKEDLKKCFAFQKTSIIFSSHILKFRKQKIILKHSKNIKNQNLLKLSLIPLLPKILKN